MKFHKKLCAKIYIIGNKNHTYKCMYLNRGTSISFFLKFLRYLYPEFYCIESYKNLHETLNEFN